MRRQYLRVTPTSATLDPSIIHTSLTSLHKLSTSDSGVIGRQLIPFLSEPSITFEFVVLSAGEDEPVEFYYGASARIDVLLQRLRTIYPESFDIDPVEIDLLEELLVDVPDTSIGDRRHIDEDHDVASGNPDSQFHRGNKIETDGGEIQTELSTYEITPYGVRWRGSVERRKDWMTPLQGFSDSIGPANHDSDIETPHSGRAPLAPLIDQLTNAKHPMAFQVVFQRKSDWSKQARRRAGALLSGKDTLVHKLLSFESAGHPRTRTGTHRTRISNTSGGVREQAGEPELSEIDWKDADNTRLEQIKANSPDRTFSVNARLIAFPRPEASVDVLEGRLDDLCAVFDPIDGNHYEIEGERIRHSGLLDGDPDRSAREFFERFRTRSMEKRKRDRVPKPTNRPDSRPDLVLNADELANFVMVPSATDLTVQGSRGARAEQQSRNPLPRPDQDIIRDLRTPGLEIGHLLDENREIEDEPIRLPPELLPFHVGRFAKTGAGKSVALINDALSVYEQTSGPVFLIDTKGGGLPEHYMRAHAKRFGPDDLEDNVLHFDIPERLPGFAFFNIEPALANGVPRAQAIKDRVDHYVEVLKMTMGEERYEQAVVSPNLLKYLIRLMYDEEHGLEHGHYRESVDYFGQSQLEQVVDQLYAAGPPQADPAEAPESSDDEVTSKIHRHLTTDPRTFANIMGGVSNRMDYITADPFLKQIFDTTEPQFDMREVLDDDVVVFFDLGDLRSDAAKVMAGVILTNLYDAVTERDSGDLAAKPDDYVANLLIDEASSIVVSDILNDLLEQGREFKLSVELASQFPEQMELEGDREVYLNVLNNIGTPIVGKIAVDDEIARALAHEGMDPVEFRNRVRALPRGEWIAQVPSTTFGETGPMPFSVGPLPLPDGHPDGDVPLSTAEERRFSEAVDRVHERTQAEYGVPVDVSQPTARTPESLQRVLELATDGIDELLAVMTRYVQLQQGVRESNGWVPVRAVDELLETWYETDLPTFDCDDPEDEREVPSRETLADIRDRSPLFELAIDADREETTMRLTESGERSIELETGDVQAAGGSGHDRALETVEEVFTRAGYLIAPVQQDGSEQPDAWAVHPETDSTLALEVETTTHTKPAKVLTNLARAQDLEAVPVFIVPNPDDDGPGVDLTIADRVANILSDPVKERVQGRTVLYTGTDHITFNGGADAENGLTAVRPTASGTDSRSNRTCWRKQAGEYVLADESGTEHARVDDIDAAPKEQFPATYSIDQDSGIVTVSVPGELPQSYESHSAFREDWVPVKRPFVPSVDLPVEKYDSDGYSIAVLDDGDQGIQQIDGCVAIYDEGELHSIDHLADSLEQGAVRTPTDGDRRLETSGPNSPEPHQIDESDPSDQTVSSADNTDSEPSNGVAAFASDCLVEDDGNVVPFGDVYEAYEAYTHKREFDPISATHFTPELKKHVAVESKSKWHDGETQQCYVGVAMIQDRDRGGDKVA